MRKSNLTYNELIELAPKDRPFQIEVGEKEDYKMPEIEESIKLLDDLFTKAQDIINKYKK